MFVHDSIETRHIAFAPKNDRNILIKLRLLDLSGEGGNVAVQLSAQGTVTKPFFPVTLETVVLVQRFSTLLW